MSIKPKTKHNYIGIEIECFSEFHRGEVTTLISSLGLSNYIEVGNDGSIEPDGPDVRVWDNYYNEWVFERAEDFYNRLEFRVLSKETELPSIMSAMSDILQIIDAKVNDTCGLHVHLDMRQRNKKISVNNLFDKQDEMFKIVAKERADNSYCVWNNRPNEFWIERLHELAKAWSKYTAINLAALNEHGTIEIRIHEGTVNTAEILNWCRYLIATVDNKPLTLGLQSYVKNRTNKKVA